MQTTDLFQVSSGSIVAGVDEVGRGPLAGDVVAAAVILGDSPPAGLTDSKALSPRQRERLAETIRSEAVAWSLGRATVAEIDELNILQASLARHAARCRGAIGAAVSCFSRWQSPPKMVL